MDRITPRKVELRTTANGGVDRRSVHSLKGAWNHIIPAVYLKAWRDRRAGQPAQVWLLDSTTLQGRLFSCKEALRELDFYLTIDDRGEPTDHIERVLGLAESRLGFIRRELELGRDLQETDRRKLWEFVAGMFIRTLPWRHRLQITVEACRRIVFEQFRRDPVIWLESQLKRKLSRKERRLVSGGRGRTFVETRLGGFEAPIEMLADQIVSQAHGALIQTALDTVKAMTLPFCIGVSQEVQFVSCDAPSFIEERLDSLGALGDAVDSAASGATWLMPLSPSRVFVGGLRVEPGYYPLTSAEVVRINARIRRNADQLLVSSGLNLKESDFRSLPDEAPSMREIADKAVLGAIEEKRQELFKP